MLSETMELQKALVELATGGTLDEVAYQRRRKALMAEETLRGLIPDFVLRNRTANALWAYFKSVSPHWQPRRAHIWDAFNPLLDYLEGSTGAPADIAISNTLESFDTEGVHQVRTRALQRRHSDPQGAITLSHTLLEVVCKRILEAGGISFGERDDLPKLYHRVAQQLSLAPSQHTEEAFKAILGSCQSVVNNRLSTADGERRRVVTR